MNRLETLEMLALLRAAYPAFYSRLSPGDMRSVEVLWCEMFAGDDIAVVKYSLHKLIESHSGYPPDIAAVKQKIRELTAAVTGEPTDEELWGLLRRAVANGLYGAKEEFEKLPAVLKTFLGSPSTLTEYAMIDSDTFNTVTHGQFLKQIPSVKSRADYRETMPDFLREYIEKFKLPKGHEPLDPREENSRRNAILSALEGKK